MTATAQPAYRAIRNKLLISCAGAALATAGLAPQKARAQAAPSGAFQGNPTTVNGTVDYNRGDGVETITVSSGSARIDWSPYDGRTGIADNIDFLPAGNTATFTSSTGLLDYTVLNRILPTDPNRAIELNGNVISTLEGGTATGGRIWFYSPGGILIGSSAVVDVGSLLLTTADPGDGWAADGAISTCSPEPRNQARKSRSRAAPRSRRSSRTATSR